MVKTLTDLVPLIAVLAFWGTLVLAFKLHRRARRLTDGLAVLASCSILQVAQTIINLCAGHTPAWTLWITSGGTTAIAFGYLATVMWRMRRQLGLRRFLVVGPRLGAENMGAGDDAGA